MAHTPGPWWIDEDGDYLCICDGEVNEYGEREEVATLACNRPSLRHCQPANARLIAAAPELLEALRAALGTIQYLLTNSDNGPADNCLGVIEEAIAKAEAVTMEGTNGKERSLD